MNELGSPSTSIIYSELAQIYQEQQKYEDAINFLQKVLKIQDIHLYYFILDSF